VGFVTDPSLRFPIRFHPVNAVLMRVVGMSRTRSYVEVDGDVVRVRAGLAFRADIPRASIRAVEPRPYVWSAYGVHGWSGRWIVNGSGHGVVSLTVDPPAPARVLGLPVRLRELWVSLVEPDRLQAALARP
jgi:hypothetical protein